MYFSLFLSIFFGNLFAVQTEVYNFVNSIH
jgi:hypothetical protein